MANNVQATFDRLAQLPGVLAAILVDGNGVPVRTTMSEADTIRYANRMGGLVSMARSMVREIEPTDELSYVRLRTRKQELMVATENQYTIILIQDNAALDESRRGSVASKRRSMVN